MAYFKKAIEGEELHHQASIPNCDRRVDQGTRSRIDSLPHVRLAVHEHQSELLSKLYGCQMLASGASRVGSRATSTHGRTDCRLAEYGPVPAYR